MVLQERSPSGTNSGDDERRTRRVVCNVLSREIGDVGREFCGGEVWDVEALGRDDLNVDAFDGCTRDADEAYLFPALRIGSRGGSTSYKLSTVSGPSLSAITRLRFFERVRSFGVCEETFDASSSTYVPSWLCSFDCELLNTS